VSTTFLLCAINQEYIPVIAVMCNPGLKARHWDHMSEVAKIDLMPDSSTTLRKMMLLNIMPYMEQFDAVSASATKVLNHNVLLIVSADSNIGY